ncbi:hypothetical protein Ais01nite_18260 [Asanoa ishikariensis]|uniref:Intracellular septation protein A n=1 Tax=Asanoa ishikariensis TaxID=137265 RepID=A0A1H3UDR9_9ACTN|nr:hypothetical protein [Asanoa ishikariensis]GIF63791.1 hypothetical protein Ais01nite_18260 [Asanoa ishikariensis]SDZ60437.1 Intracellular septation protein A [Asanoa ishikariensis]
MRAARLFAETVLVPTGLLYILLHTAGLLPALLAVIGWSVITVTIRWVSGRHLPGTLLVCSGAMIARASVALALSSALVYFVQPVIASVFMAALFLGSALLGRPITKRLARDFVALPAHLRHHPGLHKVFVQTAALWGIGRLVDAGMSMGFLHMGLDAAVLSRGVFSGILTAVMVAVCAAWGFRALRKMPDLSFRIGLPKPTAAPAAAPAMA